MCCPRWIASFVVSLVVAEAGATVDEYSAEADAERLVDGDHEVQPAAYPQQMAAQPSDPFDTMPYEEVPQEEETGQDFAASEDPNQPLSEELVGESQIVFESPQKVGWWMFGAEVIPTELSMGASNYNSEFQQRVGFRHILLMNEPIGWECDCDIGTPEEQVRAMTLPLKSSMRMRLSISSADMAK